MSTPAPPRPGAEPALVGPADVRVNARGKGHYTREVHDLFVDDPHAARLMVGETFNPPGNWSSYPPHKHDGADGEPRLEEVYHFRISPDHGFAHQSLYTTAGECVTHQVKDGDAVLLPYRLSPGVGAARLSGVLPVGAGRRPAAAGAVTKIRSTAGFTISPTSSTRAFDSRR